MRYKKHLLTLGLGHDEISDKIKSNYGRTFHKLCITNIICFTQRKQITAEV